MSHRFAAVATPQLEVVRANIHGVEPGDTDRAAPANQPVYRIKQEV
ncbi:MAG: hypothetical protein GH143_08825 [Calditrichaeota bacterium]|nr:hypothetical protein [Calditrichota bacterium]